VCNRLPGPHSHGAHNGPLPQIISLRTDVYVALAASDYAALAARVHGDKFALRCALDLDYAARIATRVSTLVCIERSAGGIDLALAQLSLSPPPILNGFNGQLAASIIQSDDVWREIVSYL